MPPMRRDLVIEHAERFGLARYDQIARSAWDGVKEEQLFLSIINQPSVTNGKDVSNSAWRGETVSLIAEKRLGIVRGSGDCCGGAVRSAPLRCIWGKHRDLHRNSNTGCRDMLVQSDPG